MRKKTWDLYAPIYERAMRADQRIYTFMYERIPTVIRDRDVLEIATGPGLLAKHVAPAARTMLAIDYSDGMVEHIKENMANRGLECKALQMDAQNLKFEDESFDAIVQRNVMWNLDEPEKAYAEIYRVLKPGGIFLIDDGNHYLSAHDEEYAEAAAKRRAEFEARMAKEDMTPGSHYRHNPENVDFKIIEEIAKEQPMSYRRRPQWDLDQMIRLGFKDIHVEIFGKGLPGRYIVVAKKSEEI